MIRYSTHISSTISIETPETPLANACLEHIENAYRAINKHLTIIDLAYDELQEERIVNSIVQHCLTGK